MEFWRAGLRKTGAKNRASLTERQNCAAALDSVTKLMCLGTSECKSILVVTQIKGCA